MQPAFDRYGGFATISKVVMAFFDRISHECRLDDFGEHEIRGFGCKQIFRLVHELKPANDVMM